MRPDMATEFSQLFIAVDCCRNYEYCNGIPGEILLVMKIFIKGEQRIEAMIDHLFQEITIF